MNETTRAAERVVFEWAGAGAPANSQQRTSVQAINGRRAGDGRAGGRRKVFIIGTSISYPRRQRIARTVAYRRSGC